MNIENKENLKISLSTPSVKFKDSYIEAIKEFQKEGKRDYLDINSLESNFDSLIQKLDDESKGLNLKKGQVPQVELWLIKNGKYVGDIRIRAELNEQLEKIGGNIGYGIRPSERKRGYGKLILQLGLQKARGAGLKEVMITCDETNIGSKKIIESNGGQLIDCRKIEGHDTPVCRFVIKLI